MKEIFKRLLTGILYIIVMLGGVLRGGQTFDLLITILGIFCFWEYMNITKIKAAYAYIIYLALIFYCFVIQEEYFVRVYIYTTCFINILLVLNLYLNKRFNEVQKHIIGLTYIFGGIVALRMLPYNVFDFFDTAFIISIFCMIWINDTFAYLVGKRFGKRKLFPSISPKKTWEGFIGGAIGTLIVSYICYLYDSIAISFTALQWYTIASLLIIFGVYGDLVESKFKRISKVKDSGNILPAHGGILDRLDSLLFISPIIYLILQIYIDVS